LDPTLLKKKRRNDGEADTLTTDEDSDEDKDPLLSSIVINSVPPMTLTPRTQTILMTRIPLNTPPLTMTLTQRCHHLLTFPDLLVFTHLEGEDDEHLG
jgi:hypothetical protein